MDQPAVLRTKPQPEDGRRAWGSAGSRRDKILLRQRLAIATATALCAGLCASAQAQDVAQGAANRSDAGFYGGVVLRQGTQDSTGVRIGHLDSPWGKFVAPTADESASRTLFFGGYRWRNDLAVEAAFASAESYALTPAGRRGVGLSLAGLADNASARSWNADVYTSWSFRRSFALYGRLGYTQSDTVMLYAPATLTPGDARRTRDGVNYGVGLRYDVTPALGLRVEYARFGRFAGETVSGFLPESDQVQFGMQFRF
jgi:opacity protein-like surface antigen